MEKTQIAVVMVPLPMQSHLNLLLQLSAVISSYGLPVHYIGSATHNRQAKLRATGLKPESIAKIHFHDFPTTTFPPLDPSKYDLGKFPVHAIPAIMAYNNFQENISALVQELSTKTRRVVIVFDRFISEAVGGAISTPNVESYAFNCISAFDLFYIMWEAKRRQFNVEGDINHLPSATQFYDDQFINSWLASEPGQIKDRAGDLYNTTRLIDGKYIDLLAREEMGGNNKKHWAVGLNLHGKFSETDDIKTTRHKCLAWLDRQAPRSVIYVSFGTSISLSDEETKELATGLEQSNQKFIWVLRCADKVDIFSGDNKGIELPEGFEERVQDNGMVVKEWVPQTEILAHKSTGGFISHCGWNSCLESLSMGVPIAAWPMHTDQPVNAIFLTKFLKVGLILRDWAHRGELIKASDIKNVVERLIASEEGDEIRKRAEELSAVINSSMEEGGESRKDLDSFIAHITR